MSTGYEKVSEAAASPPLVGVHHYFAYGSNMNPARLRQRGLRFGSIRGACLPGMKLVFDKVSRQHPNAAHANILYAPGQWVEGVLYQLEDAVEILQMDPFEHAPWNYGRDVVQVVADGAGVSAWTYFANRAVRRPGLKPPTDYLAHLLVAKEFLSTNYFRRLANMETVDDSGGR